MRQVPFFIAVLAAVTIFDSPLIAQSVDAPSSRAVGEVSHPPAASQSQPASFDSEKPASAASTTGSSQVRIVRLSETRGEVQLDRNTGNKFEPAFVNIPIIAGERLQTADGLAEVEFEDNSSLRLAPKTLIEFPVLERSSTGVTETEVRLVSGSVYFSLAEGKGTESIKVSVGSRTIMLTPSSHVRLDAAGAIATLHVLHGSATVANASGAEVVTKKKAVSLDLAAASAPVVLAHAEAESPLDRWDKAAASYHQVRASSAFANASPYAYGVADLSYYGSFSTLGGCGSLWRPYLANASWDPYQTGVWTMYPGSGYSWVSLYPWGWTPYHSGSWEYCPSGSGAGGSWGWRPSSSWTALKNHPPVGPIHGPRRPLPPPRAGEATLVGVNLKGVPVSRVESGQTFTFRAGSAGMGVPRNVFGDLGKIAQHVTQQGFATSSVTESQAQRGMMAIAAGRGEGSLHSATSSSGNVTSRAHAGGSAVSSLGAGSMLSAGSMHSASSSAAGPSPAGGGSGHH